MPRQRATRDKASKKYREFLQEFDKATAIKKTAEFFGVREELVKRRAKVSMPSPRPHKMGIGLKRYAELAMDQINIKKLGKNLDKKECVYQIKKQLSGLDIPKLYDTGIARIIFDARQKEFKKKGILQK